MVSCYRLNKNLVSREENYSNVQCTLAGSNLGYAKGNNLGLSKVKTNYALILNPDSILSKKASESLKGKNSPKGTSIFLSK